MRQLISLNVERRINVRQYSLDDAMQDWGDGVSITYFNERARAILGTNIILDNSAIYDF